MANVKSLPIQINRKDYKNPTKGGGVFSLPLLHNLNDITDVNEVSSINLGHFYNKEEALALQAQFPKSYKAATSYGYDWDDVNKCCLFDKQFWEVHFSFDTFWTNKTTGATNEAAAARRLKVINKIKQIIN